MLTFDRISVPLQQALGGALRRLTHLAHTNSWSQWASQRLTPTQRKILELLASRRERLMLSAVAQELGVTPATASDSLSALQAKGLVNKERSDVDGRALAIVLTQEGLRSATALAALPDPLQAAFEALSPPEQETLYRLTVKMIRGLQQSGALPVSRMCVRCVHFDPSRYQDSPTPHHCHFYDAPFGDRHLRVDCPDHVFNGQETQEAVWMRFSDAGAKKNEDVAKSQ